MQTIEIEALEVDRMIKSIKWQKNKPMSFDDLVKSLEKLFASDLDSCIEQAFFKLGICKHEGRISVEIL